MEKKHKYKTWGDVFYKCIRSGHDQGWAAYRADLWEERHKRKNSKNEILPTVKIGH